MTQNVQISRGARGVMRRRHSLMPLAALLGAILLCTCATEQKNILWDDSFYDTFSPASFKEYAPANRTLDFKDINYPLLDAAIFFEVNRVRAFYGRHTCRHSRALERVAASYSREMAGRNFFGHYDIYDSGERTPSERMTAVGVAPGFLAENIAIAFGIRYKEGSPVIPPGGDEKEFRDFRTAEVIPPHSYNSFAAAVVEGWMQSDPHRANILDERVKFLGSGAFYFEDRKFHNIPAFKVTLDLTSSAPD
jgi:uncharacterized protein YkwD